MGELFERVCAEVTLFDAWRRVEHKGARGGIDQVTISTFRQRLNDNLEQLRADLGAGRYVPEPFQKINIPKADDPGATRPLQMPTVRDKIAQEAVRSVIAPILEKTFADCSYAYRPGKGPQKTIRRVEHYLSVKKHWVADADIDRFFDAMDQRLTLDEVQKHITEPEIVRLLALWMKMGAVDARGRWVDPLRGVAQGSVISPLLSNVYLTPFDTYLTQKGHALVRYADNFLLLASSSEAAAQALAEARAFLQQRLRLQLNAHARPIASLASGFVFLGSYFRGELRRIAHSKIDQMKAEIRRFWQRYASAPVPRLVAELNESLLGWQRYYGMVQPHQQFQELDGYIAEGLARALAMRMHTGGTVRNTDLYEHLKELTFLRHVPQAERQGAIGQIVRRARVMHEGTQPGGSPRTPPTSPVASSTAAPRPAQGTPTAVAPTAAAAPPPPSTASPVTVKSPEQQAAQAVRTQKRRYLRQAVQGAELVISEPGVFLGKTSRRVVVKKQRRVIMEMPLKQLRHIIIATPGVTLSSAVIAFCAQGNVPMDFLTPRGEPLARLCAPLDALGNTGLEQLRAVHDGSGLRLAQTIVDGKLRNQLNLVKYYHKYRKRVDEAFAQAFVEVEQQFETLIAELKGYEPVGDYEVVRHRLFAFEGHGGNLYWQMVRLLLDDDVKFAGRERQGATDLVNSLLNYGYGMLYPRVHHALVLAGLNPCISFLHSFQDGKPTLVFDMIETSLLPARTTAPALGEVPAPGR